MNAKMISIKAKRTGYAALTACAALLCTAAGAQEAVDPAALEDLASEWVDLRLQTAGEKRSWQTDKEFIRREIKLLEKQSAALDAELEELRGRSGATDVEIAEMERERIHLRNALEGLHPVLGRMETFLLGWVDKVPASVGRGFLDIMKTVPDQEPEREAVSPARRLQTALAAFTELETLQNEYHTAREMLDMPDARREMDVLYIGLARAYAVGRGSASAAIGRPGVFGWTWEPANEHAEAFREAFDTAAGRRPAGFVRLPLDLKVETP